MLNKIFSITALLLFAGTAAVTAQTAQGDSDLEMLSSQKFTLTPGQIDAGIRGLVKVAFTVTKAGDTKRVIIFAGPAWPCGATPAKEIEEVRMAVKESIESAKFSPRVKNGKPVETDAMLSFDIDKALARPPSTGKAITGGVINGRAIRLAKPDYPADARANRISGSTEIQVLIDETGKVISAGAVGGHPYLQLAGRAAACESSFSPTLLAGHPVKVSGIITYNFRP